MLFQEVYCMYCNTTNRVKTMVCCAAINSLEITLILQPARSDVKIGLFSARENQRCAESDFFHFYSAPVFQNLTPLLA